MNVAAASLRQAEQLFGKILPPQVARGPYGCMDVDYFEGLNKNKSSKWANGPMFLVQKRYKKGWV